MQYILTTAEYDSLTPVKRLQERNEALEVARKIIMPDEDCKKLLSSVMGYCTDCPIGNIKDHKIRNHICIRPKHWPK